MIEHNYGLILIILKGTVIADRNHMHDHRRSAPSLQFTSCMRVWGTYWSQICWEWARGRRSARCRWGVAVSVAQGAFALADESLLVLLHPLELLVGAHLPPLPRHRVSGVQTLQGALWSLLRWVGGKDACNTNPTGRLKCGWTRKSGKFQLSV